MSQVSTSYWQKFTSQYTALVRKNALLAVRNKRATLLQLAASFFFIFFIWGVDESIKANNARLTRLKNIRTPDATPFADLHRCILTDDAPGDQCWTLVYAPQDDDNVLKVIDNFKAITGVPDDEVRGFDDQTDIDEFLLAYPNTTQASVYIDPGLNWEHIEYVLQVNTTPYFFAGNFEERQAGVHYPTQLAIEKAIRQVLFEDEPVEPEIDLELKGYPHPALVSFSTVGTIGPTFIFAGALFGFVVQISEIVAERELNLRQTMTIMGLYDSAFWLSWATTEFVKLTISSVLLCAFGAMFQFDFFLKNAFGTYFFLIFLFQLAQMSWAFFLSVFLSKAQTASTIGFIMFIFGFVLQTVVQFGFPYDNGADISLAFRPILAFFPPVLLAKGLSDLGQATATSDDDGISWANRGSYETKSFALDVIYEWLLIDFILFFAIAVYLDKVLPDKEGVRQHPLFFLNKSYWTEDEDDSTGGTGGGASGGDGNSGGDDGGDAGVGAGAASAAQHSSAARPRLQGGDGDMVRTESIVEERLEDETQDDSDVLDEERDVKSNFDTYAKNSAVVVDGLSKRFGNYQAVVPNWYQIPRNSLFCLLGPNGAGKTTSIKMLTGVLPPSGGDALVEGYSIKGSGMNKIRHIIGLCPQFDMVWDRLTGREHLRLYAVLSNRVPLGEIENEVNERLEQVSLTKASNMRTSQYSGGMKRRLSVAIALIGDPKVVFLDEPTTGMDPVHRRQVWNIINKAKKGRAVILTTHSMEEADILGDRIAILAKGRLRCLGSSIRLKRKFGTGYKITTTFTGADNLYASAKIMQPLPEDIAQPSGDEADDEKAATEAKMQATIEFVKKYFPECQISQDELAGVNNSLLSFVIARSNESKLPDFVNDFEDQHKKLGVQAFDISLTTLEDVFLEIARLAEVDHARKDNLTVPIELSSGVTTMVPVGEKRWVDKTNKVVLNIEWYTDDSGALALKTFSEGAFES